MDETFYVPAAILGGVLILLHIVVALRSGTRPDLPAMVSCLLHSSGLVAGGILILSTFVPTLRTRVQHLGVYITIGGLAVIFVSVQGAYRAVRAKP